MAGGVTTEVRDGRTVAVKRGDPERLAAEAALLAAADHPGVVSLLDRDETSLVMALAGTRTLDPATDDPGVLAALAATVADLHELGVVHGSIEPAHVIIASDGHPVLCGFADGGFVDAGADPAADVRALGDLLLATGQPALRPIGERATSGVASARSIAASLHLALARPAPRERRIDRRVTAAAAAMVVALVAGLVLVRTGGSGTTVAAPPTTTPTTTATSTTTTTTDPPRPSGELVWPPPDAEPVVVEFDGARYQVGEPGDDVAVGDWDCDGTATPAVLRPATGAVFVFTSWADATLTPSGRIEGATGIRTADPDGDGCADALVETPDGEVVVS